MLSLLTIPTMSSTRARRKWLTPSAIVLVTIVLSLGAAVSTTLRTSRETLERYVSVWEEEVARNLLLKGDTQLFEKIRMQILDLASDVEATGESANLLSVQGRCFGEQSLNVTLYGTPAGELRVCRSPEKLAWRSLSSPVFAFGLLVGLILTAWLVRRASREEADRELRDLAIKVAHDIRSPVMALQIAARSQSDSDSETQQMIESAARRISSIADDLLEKGREKRKSVATDVATQAPAAVKSLKTAVQDLIAEKKSTTDTRVTFDLSPWRTEAGATRAMATGDLERVLSNLLQNAIEATLVKWKDPETEGTPRVSVDGFESSREILITVRDNGIGIPKHILPEIGREGFSYGKAMGNGLGFSSALNWARSLGGNLEIRSLEGTGTEVRLSIPRA